MPAVPEIIVRNNQDGTATVTVSGCEDDAAVSVRAMRIDHQWPVNEWLEQGTRTGNGDVTVECNAGVFWFSVCSTLASATAWSVPAYSVVSDGTLDIFDQIIDAVVARIRLLSLDCIDSSKVIPHLILTQDFVKSVKENHVLVGQADGEQPLAGGPTTRDRYGYRVAIALAAPANQDQERRGLWNKWREFIRHAFVNQGLVTATGTVVYGTFLPISGTIRSYWERNCYASVIGIEFLSEEFRGMRV